MKARSRGRKLWLACSMEKSVPWEEDRQRAGGQREGSKQQQDDECPAVFAGRASVGVAMGVGERGVVQWVDWGIGGLVRAFTSLAPPQGRRTHRAGASEVTLADNGQTSAHHDHTSRPLNLSELAPSLFVPAPDFRDKGTSSPLTTVKHPSMGIKRSRSDSLSSEAESTLSARSRSREPSVKIVHLDSTAATSATPVMKCSLPPHQPLTFKSFEDYDVHYQKTHVNRCQECRKNFPDEHFLHLHIAENHDPFFAAKKERGEKMVGERTFYSPSSHFMLFLHFP